MPQDPYTTERAVAAYLAELDRMEQSLALPILDGKCTPGGPQSYEAQTGQLRGIRAARGAYLNMLDDETRRRLGVERPKPPPVEMHKKMREGF